MTSQGVKMLGECVGLELAVKLRPGTSVSFVWVPQFKNCLSSQVQFPTNVSPAERQVMVPVLKLTAVGLLVDQLWLL